MIGEEGKQIPAEDRGFLYGDGLFETVRVQQGRPFFLEVHRRRFEASAQALGFPKSSVSAGLQALEGLSGRRDGLWRVTVTRDDPAAFGGGSGVVRLRRRDIPPPVEAIVASVVYGAYFPKDSLAELKTTSWLRSVIARQRAVQRGAQEAIMADHQGRLGEASAANLFIKVADAWCTPPVEGLLPGVMRQHLLAQAPKRGLKIDVRPISVADLAAAQAVALTSTGRGVVAVEAVDDHSYEIGEVQELGALIAEDYDGP